MFVGLCGVIVFAAFTVLDVGDATGGDLESTCAINGCWPHACREHCSDLKFLSVRNFGQMRPFAHREVADPSGKRVSALTDHIPHVVRNTPGEVVIHVTAPGIVALVAHVLFLGQRNAVVGHVDNSVNRCHLLLVARLTVSIWIAVTLPFNARGFLIGLALGKNPTDHRFVCDYPIFSTVDFCLHIDSVKKICAPGPVRFLR